MKIELTNNIEIVDVSAENKEVIKEAFTIPNPKHQEALRAGRWVKNIPKVLKYYQIKKDRILCPRGSLNVIQEVLNPKDTADHRKIKKSIPLTFHGQLKDFQQIAMEECLKEDNLLLCAPTGSGKTVMGLYMIAQRKQPTLIVVHTRDLMKQWSQQINKFLKVPPGFFGGGELKVKNITVATIQTLIKHAEYVSKHFGHLVLDECHKAPAIQYAKTISCFDCRYVTGLSATPYRNDGLSQVINWYVGPIAYKIEKEMLLRTGNLCPAEVRWITTELDIKINASQNYSKALSALTKDEERNKLIADVIAVSKEKGVHLILSDRKEHCKDLYRLLKSKGIRCEVLTGSVANRPEVIERLKAGKSKYLIATSQLIGEGFDLPSITVLFLTTPIKFNGRLIQYIGRALRTADGKEKAIIYEFVDVMNPVFWYSARHRAKTYKDQQIDGWQDLPKTHTRSAYMVGRALRRR